MDSQLQAKVPVRYDIRPELIHKKMDCERKKNAREKKISV